MTDILETIYRGGYQVMYTPTKEYREVERQMEPLWEQVEAALSEEFAEELRRHVFRLADLENLGHYRMGFRLGALLTLELLDTSSK